MLKRLIIGLLGTVAVLAATACTGTAGITVGGPSPIVHNEPSWFWSKIDGAAPLLGFATVYHYIDLDGDKFPDTNERFVDPLFVEIDRLGQGTTWVSFTPTDFFGSKPIPSSVKMSVYARLYWSDPTVGYETLRDSKTVKITTDN